MKHRITRKDIAEAVGTSVSVVSRALNNSGYVAADKKQAILQTARRLGYLPHPVPTFITQSRMPQVLYYCDDMRNPYHIHFYQGMLDIARSRGFMVLANGSLDFSAIDRFLIDGIILPNESAARKYLEESGSYRLPAVCASYHDSNRLSRPLPLVECDMYQVFLSALNYLWRCGHRKIAYGAPERLSHDGPRNCAFYSWCAEKRIQTPQRMLLSIPHPADSMDFFSLGIACASLLRAHCPEATALLCFNDEFALGALRGFQAQGIKVPEEISVMGIDGIYSRRYVAPLLTTMDIFPEQHGRASMEVLLRMLESKNYKHVTHTSFCLAEGESVAPPREVVNL